MNNTNDTSYNATQKVAYENHGAFSLPPFPSSPILAHIAKEWIEKVKPVAA